MLDLGHSGRQHDRNDDGPEQPEGQDLCRRPIGWREHSDPRHDAGAVESGRDVRRPAVHRGDGRRFRGSVGACEDEKVLAAAFAPALSASPTVRSEYQPEARHPARNASRARSLRIVCSGIAPSREER
jgi:hypothetical protein